jgi:uncharacterized protein YggU (UPF0235/DUF167 family)
MYLKVRVTADAKENRITPKGPDAFIVQVRAEAREGRANAAVIAVLARHLNVPPSALRLIKGAHSPSKIFELRGR